MSEMLTHDESVSGLQKPESRFGNKAEIISAMEDGEVETVGLIEDYLPEIPAHRNVVELAKVGHEEIDFRNKPELVRLENHGKQFWCVFKSLEGEDHDFVGEAGQQSCYTRELAAYFVSDHFGLDIVPPTAIKKVNDRVGSLQLFIPHDEFVMGHETLDKLSEEDWNLFITSPDMQKMQILDWLICNADRNDGNFLYRARVEDLGGERNVSAIKNASGFVDAIAIDHGLSFNSAYYAGASRTKNIAAPYHSLTFDSNTMKPVINEAPEALLKLVASGSAQHQKLTEALSLLEDIGGFEIEGMWQRVEQFLSYEVFLSGENISYVKNKPR